MTKPATFLDVVWYDDWKRSYAALSVEEQRACDSAVRSLIEQEVSSGLRVKPILPGKYYLEARATSGDRIIFRAAGGTIFAIDIVTHDDVARYGRRPKGRAS